MNKIILKYVQTMSYTYITYTYNHTLATLNV